MNGSFALFDRSRLAVLTNVAGIVVGIVLGVYLRCLLYAEDRSLWLDAANLAFGIVERSYSDLWKPLVPATFGHQIAPIGFLIPVRFFGGLFDYSEMSLTFVPLLCGLAALPLFVVLCRLVLTERTTAFVAFLPFALCSGTVYYSAELKPYSMDLLFSLLLLVTVFRYVKRGGERDLLLLLGTGTLAPWFSVAAIIVLGGIGAGLVLLAAFDAEWRRAHGRALRRLLPVWTVSVALDYFLLLSPALHKALYEFHFQGFAPLTVWNPESVKWYLAVFRGVFRHPLGLGDDFYVPAALLIAGAISFFRRDRRTLAFLLLPLLVLLALSAARQYPINPVFANHNDVQSRLILFTVPIFYLLIAEGVALAGTLTGSRLVAAGAAAAFLVPWTYHTAVADKKFMRQETRPLIEYYREHRSPEDKIYLHVYSIAAFRYYTRKNRLEAIEGKWRGWDVPSYHDDLDALKGKGRVWFLLTNLSHREMEAFQAYLDTLGRRTEEKTAEGARLYRYTL